MRIQMVEVAFRHGLADVAAAADQLRRDRDRATRQVDALLDGDWRGAAATAFAGAFDDWRRGARDVLDGLLAMGELMRAASAAAHATDDASATALQEVSARIVERLS